MTTNELFEFSLNEMCICVDYVERERERAFVRIAETHRLIYIEMVGGGGGGGAGDVKCRECPLWKAL